MSRLTVYNDDAPSVAVFDSQDPAEVAAALAIINTGFERWESPVTVTADTPAEEILAAYKPYLDALMGTTGAGSADVVKLTPDHPMAAELRAKFLNEHIHSEDEIRFFVAGSGHFVLHEHGKVHVALCEAGDLIRVPAGIKHWFDAGLAPNFTALRIFTHAEGWIPHFTGSDISKNFPTA
jgi:1,2-dihydroxy-3-keto-5-methylthiopentene dioxygenase